MPTETRRLGASVHEYVGKPVAPDLMGPAIDLVGAMADLQDAFGELAIDAPTATELTASLRAMVDLLQAHRGPEEDRFYGRMVGQPTRGQTFARFLEPTRIGANDAAGTVRFGSFYAGPKGAVHGGAVMAFLDEAAGWLISATGRPRSRTAYFHTDFRSLTPANVDLDVELHFREEIGRKMFVVATIRQGDTVCAEAEGLFLHMLEGQD